MFNNATPLPSGSGRCGLVPTVEELKGCTASYYIIAQKHNVFSAIFITGETKISELLDIIITPVNDSAPTGENISHDPDFDALKAEIGKLGESDYDLVEEKARGILKSKSKDCRVLSFLSLALLRKERWEAFADLFDGYAQLAQKDFDALFPQRPRAKQMALTWLSEEKFVDALGRKNPSERDHEHITRLVQALGVLREIAEKQFPDAPPLPSALIKHALDWEKKTRPKPGPEPAAAGPAGGASSGGEAEPMDTPKQAQTLVRKAARFLIENEPEKTMGYRLMRAARWDVLEQAPPAQDGKTQLQGPNAQQRSFFQNLLSQNDWKTLREKAEEVFAGGGAHLWLDLQRYGVLACDNLGESWKRVGEAIMRETGMLLRRLPGLAELRFADGSPFCDEATRDWLGSDVRKMLGDDGEEVPEGGADAGDPFEEERKEVNALMSSGQVEKALDMLQRAMRNSDNEELNFKRSILLGRVLLKGKQPDIAVSVLESLDEKIGVHGLDKWNPDLAIEAWSMLVQACKVGRSQKPQAVQVAMTERHDTILRRISQINPRKAFDLNK